VIELKKENSQVPDDFDLLKLRKFTSSDDENEYKYKWGVFIRLPIKNPSNKPVIRFFQSGREI
jgi:hypothetical protein